VDTAANGVTLVRNPATPVLDSGAVHLERLWSDPVDPELLDAPVWEAGPALSVSDSSVYLLDRTGGRVRVFRAADGTPHGGWPTSAPGGRDSLFTLVSVPGRVVVGAHRELEVFPSDGSDVHRIRTEGNVRNLYALDDTSVVTLEMGGGGVGWGRYGVTDSVGRAYVPGEVRSRIAPDVMDVDCWKMDGGGGHFLIQACTRPVIMVLGEDGKMTTEIGIDRPADTASATQLDTLRALVRAKTAASDSKLPRRVLDGLVEREARRQRVAHLYRGVRYDSASGLYAVLEQVPDFLGGSGPSRLHLLTRGGVFLATVPLPSRVEAYDVAGGTLYALLESGKSPGPLLAAYRIDLPRKVHGRSDWWEWPEKRKGDR